MKRISSKLVLIFSTLWLLYFIYSIGLTIYDISTVKQINWNQANNISSRYAGKGATIITYSYQKDKVIIARKYGSFTQGLTVWSWGIDKKAQYVNISFFVKKKDYEKVVNNFPNYNTLWLSDRKDVSTLPFFGLRQIGESPNKILLFFDILKYNLSSAITYIVLFMPIIIIYTLKKVLKKNDFQMNEVMNINNKYVNIIYCLFIVYIVSRFII